MKILMIYGGPDYYYSNFISECAKIADVDGGNYLNKEQQMKLPYATTVVDYNKIEIWEEGYRDSRQLHKKYDIILGLDNGCIRVVKEFKKVGCKIVGCQILDYPKHVFKKNKDYVHSAAFYWPHWRKDLRFLDFVIHCRENAQIDLKDDLKGVPSVFHPLPCNVVDIKDYERKDYILYSGAINPAKGVHYIIDSLSLIENPPELVVVGQGYDLSGYAKFLRVPYRQLNNVSEYEKFKMYHECRFLVYGHDTGVIPGLSLLEGIGVGRTGICFSFPEHKVMYKNFAIYCLPHDISSMANSIKFFMAQKPEQVDVIAKDGPKYVKEECSFDSWAKTVCEFLETLWKE